MRRQGQGNDLFPRTRNDAAKPGRQILERLIKDVENRGLVEFRPRQEGNTLHLILAPKKDAAARRKSRL